ncbi:hypothetical protein GY45DRAFT_434043 [Cubamyces sp. BRFM 1775]|nr:hypothetical protein GY45DRAFT_434043 [Cubamyces sp. BRFM 1775]
MCTVSPLGVTGEGAPITRKLEPVFLRFPKLCCIFLASFFKFKLGYPSFRHCQCSHLIFRDIGSPFGSNMTSKSLCFGAQPVVLLQTETSTCSYGTAFARSCIGAWWTSVIQHVLSTSGAVPSPRRVNMKGQPRAPSFIAVCHDTKYRAQVPESNAR